MKRKTNTYLPLSLLEKITQKYPHVWRIMQEIHEENGLIEPSWDSCCYVPLGVTLAYVDGKLDAGINDYAIIAALAPWRLSKEVYVMDADLESLLYEQSEDPLDIPAEILLHLPYLCFYVELSRMDDIHGFFVHLEHDINNGERELRIVALHRDGTTSLFPIHLSARNIEENKKKINHVVMQNAAKRGAFRKIEDQQALAGFLDDAFSDEYNRMISKFLQIILYICSENAEVLPNAEQTLITKRTPVIKDRYSELRKWDVGKRIGASLRQKTTAPRTAERGGGSHLSPRPHVRRGHWHHFWTGPRDGDRALILRWVAPCFISPPSDEDLPVVLHFTSTKMQ